MEKTLQKPHIVRVGDQSYTLLELQSKLKEQKVKLLSDITPLLKEVVATPLASQQFALVCRTPRDYGYCERDKLPTLEAMIDHSSEEALLLCPYEVPIRLLFQKPCIVKGGQAYLVVTPPVFIEGCAQLPMVQGIKRSDEAVTKALRMITGESLVKWSLDTTFLFCERR